MFACGNELWWPRGVVRCLSWEGCVSGCLHTKNSTKTFFWQFLGLRYQHFSARAFLGYLLVVFCSIDRDVIYLSQSLKFPCVKKPPRTAATKMDKIRYFGMKGPVLSRFHKRTRHEQTGFLLLCFASRSDLAAVYCRPSIPRRKDSGKVRVRQRAVVASRCRLAYLGYVVPYPLVSGQNDIFSVHFVAKTILIHGRFKCAARQADDKHKAVDIEH